MSALIWPAAAGTPAKGASARHSAVEREVKLAVPDLDAVEARLLALVGYGARCSGEVHEFNYVLDTAQDELKGRGERLRIRDIMGRPGVQVTWKGPARLRNG